MCVWGHCEVVMWGVTSPSKGQKVGFGAPVVWDPGFLFVFGTRALTAQVTLKLDIYLRMTLNF